ncbi:MAG: hypothetical protein QOK04_1079 [Solirubrobacteraceae bacterium]|jgi:hypothetical protein|nr:hypothetical protein [Solirubrobacteraceae bacterium]
MLDPSGAEPALLTLESLLAAPISQRLHILPGVAIQTLIHGPDRMYADVSLISRHVSYPIAALSSLIPKATVDHAVGTGSFVIDAGETLEFTPAGPRSLGQVLLDACFLTPGARTPFDGAIATWPYS